MNMSRRDFSIAETLRLGRFIADSIDRPVVGWHRFYRCECGATFRGPGEVWDHTRACGSGQIALPFLGGHP